MFKECLYLSRMRRIVKSERLLISEVVNIYLISLMFYGQIFFFHLCYFKLNRVD